MGSLYERASVHILQLGKYARPQKMYPLYFFLSIIWDRSSSEWQILSFCTVITPSVQVAATRNKAVAQVLQTGTEVGKRKSAQA